MQMATLDLNKV